MISQILLFSLGLCTTLAYPQAYQFQRQVLYSPPVLAGGPPFVPQPILGVPPQQVVSNAHPSLYFQGVPSYTQREQPVVYVYSPDGSLVYLRPKDLERQGGGFVDTVLNFFQNPGSYLPIWPAGSTPQSPEKPSEAAEGTSPAEVEKPEKYEQDQGNTAMGDPSGVVVAAQPAVVAPQPQKRFYVGQPLAPLVPSAHQFTYRLQQNGQPAFDQTEIDALGERAGTAAIAFQKYLAQAKLRRQGERGEDVVSVEAGHRDATEDETTTAAATTVQPDSEIIDSQELGPSIAQAKPQAVSVAGPGGVAAAAPVGTAVVGPGGMALSAPSATAVAGAKGGPRPGSESKLRAYFKQAKLPGYHHIQF